MNRTELAKMPTYYIIYLSNDMPAAVAKKMPSAAEVADNQWLPNRGLRYWRQITLQAIIVS